MLRIIFFCLFCLSLPSLAQQNTEITITGQAAADDKNAREKALADALRNAVRQGAGVDILSESEIDDFEL